MSDGGNIFWQKTTRDLLSNISLLIIFLSLCIARFFWGPQGSLWMHLPYLLTAFTGIVFTKYFLRRFFSDMATAVALLTITGASNLFYTVAFTGFRHPVVLFTLYSILIFMTIRYYDNKRKWDLYLLAIITGLLMLFHATGYMSLAFVFLWGVHDRESWRVHLSMIRQNIRSFAIFLIIVMAVVLVPVLVAGISPGHIPLFGFRLPGTFTLDLRYTSEYLFGPGHGILLYTPFVILPVAGFWFLAENQRPYFYGVFVFCCLFLVLETCWNKLYMTNVFGQIAFVPLYAMLTIPLAAMYDRVFRRRWLSIPLILIAGGFITLSFMQSCSYREKEESDEFLIIREPEKYLQKTLVLHDFEDTTKYRYDNIVAGKVFSGNFCLQLDTIYIYSPGYNESYDFFQTNPPGIVRASLHVYLNSTDPAELGKTNLVITSVHDSILYRYRYLNFSKIPDLKAGSWNHITMDYSPPAEPLPGDRLRVNLVHQGRWPLLADDLKIELFTAK